MTLEVELSAALVAELRAEKVEAAAAAEPARPATKESSTSAPSSDTGMSPGALDRLMEVQLAMTMRFGSRKMLLREVLDLNPGSVIELDRRVQEPVDLLLDGRLVARGEVVVIEGNYGLRVTDVSPLEPG
jgi:flagellar motor switch protein FliN/FliY